MLGINELGNDLDDITASSRRWSTPCAPRSRTPSSTSRPNLRRPVAAFRARTRRSITPHQPPQSRSFPRCPAGRTSSNRHQRGVRRRKTATCAPCQRRQHPCLHQSTIWTGATGCAQRRSSAENEKNQRNRFRLAFLTVRSLVLSHGLSTRCVSARMYHTNPPQARIIPPPTAAKIMCLPPFPQARPVSAGATKTALPGSYFIIR